ncbi:hypothetical protein J2X97_000388 [Epilithonimonas hungarica]|uniref:hypothetical protein n=1 Tax=Epilithonimonas hungarica TaxID=454006 RepID=UPI002788A550|nr:hypothetical protein [Epilithonimonas hungarica]MDP9954751.1 hypothetical protein [Epilithonimonas hungarica]
MDVVIGEIINEDLKTLILNNTESSDRSNVFIETGVSTSTLRDVCYRKIPVTQYSIIGLKKLIEIAFGNAQKRESSYKRDKKYLAKILDTI